MFDTLAQLSEYLSNRENGIDGDIMLQPEEWMRLSASVPPWTMVCGTFDDPPFFWFLGHRVRQYSTTK